MAPNLKDVGHEILQKALRNPQVAAEEFVKFIAGGMEPRLAPHPLVRAVHAAGFTEPELSRIAANAGMLRDFLQTLDGDTKQGILSYLLNFDEPCQLPLAEAVLEVHRGTGLHKLERRGDDIYLDERKLILFLSENQKGAKSIGGHKLREELEKRGNKVPGKVIDCLVDHPELWPEAWMPDEHGNKAHAYAWDDIFRSGDNLCVRYACWDGGKVVSHYHWLGHGWGSLSPALSLASTSSFPAKS